MKYSGNEKVAKSDFMTKTLVIWIGALICSALWGSAFPCIKLGYNMMAISASDTAAQILAGSYCSLIVTGFSLYWNIHCQ